MRTDVKWAAGTLAVAAALAAPAAAASAAITPGPYLPCYQAFPDHSGATIPVTLTGGTPGDMYEVLATDPGQAAGSAGSVSAATPFDANGDGSATLTDIYPPGDPIVPIAGRTIDLSVEDFNAAAPGGYTTTAIGSILITNLALNVSDTPSNPHKARSVAISGTAFAHKKLYGFVTNAKGTKVLRRVYLGRANVCGYVEHKEIVAPTHFAFGSYRFYVNPGTKLDKPYSLSIPFSIQGV